MTRTNPPSVIFTHKVCWETGLGWRDGRTFSSHLGDFLHPPIPQRTTRGGRVRRAFSLLPPSVAHPPLQLCAHSSLSLRYGPFPSVPKCTFPDNTVCRSHVSLHKCHTIKPPQPPSSGPQHFLLQDQVSQIDFWSWAQGGCPWIAVLFLRRAAWKET